ncbi:MAG: Hsp70 family protein [Thermodesulfobacteriota bacterium]
MRDILCGLDLGTTNSCIAHLVQGKPVALPVEEGTAIVPSVVSFDDETGRIVVGREARNRQAAFPEHTVSSIKRLMGKDCKVTLGNRSYSPEEISSFIIEFLIQNSNVIIGQDINKVVITVPAYFNDAQRRATIRAGELAGVEVTRIINEPTAASLVYDHVSHEKETDKPILVYDLGGGTFDVSILDIKGEIKQVLASCGDTALGGDDFDERLAAFFLRHLKESTGFDFSLTDRALQVRLKDIAEKTKIFLSDRPYAQVKEVAVVSVNGKVINLDLEVARKDYEEMISDLVDKTMEKVEEALKEADLSTDDIGRIILVGGSTRTPLVQQLLTEKFELPIYHSIDPDLCVGLGAAVQSGLIAGEPLGHILLDVTAHSLGVKTIDAVDYETGEADYFSTIIRRNTKIPVRKAEVYYTTHAGQEGVNVEVYQGENPSCKENTLIGEFFFPLKPAPASSPVLTEFAYDKEGIVHISVDQKGYGNRKEVTLDVRRKKILDADAPESGQEILNYIVEKARRLIGEKSLPDDLRNELNDLTTAYETALRAGQEDDKIDDLEEKLLETIEGAEERLSEIGQG